MGITNEQLVEKAIVTTDAIASAGKLNTEQFLQFLDYVVDETALKNNARVVTFDAESLEISKIGIGTRAAVPKSEAKDPGVRRGVSTSKVTLTPKEIMVPIEVSDTFVDVNLVGASVEDTIMRIFATQLGNDLEELYISGNTDGHARLENSIYEGGSSSLYVSDSFLALQDGWQELGESGNIVDAAGANIGLSIFSEALKALPTKYRRNKSRLRWFMSPDLAQNYMEKLSTRSDVVGSNAVSGNGVAPFGIPIVEVPLWDFQPITTEHIVLNGTTATSLACAPVSNVVVTVSTLGSSPASPYALTTDYVLDATAGTVTRNGGGSIGDGDTVKVTYTANPQILLTDWMNFIIGIGKSVRLEKDRDIFASVNQYAMTVKVAIEYENLEALVKVKNLGTSV